LIIASLVLQVVVWRVMLSNAATLKGATPRGSANFELRLAMTA
jgi:hypothetical protein